MQFVLYLPRTDSLSFAGIASLVVTTEIRNKLVLHPSPNDVSVATHTSETVHSQSENFFYPFNDTSCMRLLRFLRLK